NLEIDPNMEFGIEDFQGILDELGCNTAAELFDIDGDDTVTGQEIIDTAGGNKTLNNSDLINPAIDRAIEIAENTAKTTTEEFFGDPKAKANEALNTWQFTSMTTNQLNRVFDDLTEKTDSPR
ncbi:hypothetical protein ACFL4D_02990, partial [Candidatus Margulisiibacteriota bacterium]